MYASGLKAVDQELKIARPTINSHDEVTGYPPSGTDFQGGYH
jgi:hypothetical protein